MNIQNIRQQNNVVGSVLPRDFSLCRTRQIVCPRLLRGWRFSAHAREHIDARGFDPLAVVAACEAPELTATGYNYGSERVRYVRGDLVVIACPKTRTVITALLRSSAEWDDEDARRATAGAR